MSLNSLVNLAKGKDLKFVFVGGKGGVGKTTSSSAIATLFATISQKRVLLVSTDPAHSLGDAWGTSFSNVPISPMPNLDVMEVDPKETMEAEVATWVKFAKELEEGESNEDSKIMQQVSQFQDWISGIPGIDEATALSSVINHIESGKYDLIVFDTAPTGHTLKLLALPEILEKGIEKLQSWQTTIWGYWEAFTGLTSGSKSSVAKNKANMKEEVSQKLIKYKENIQKVGTMLQDQERTRFVVVCIAEYLSVSETQRLLQELKKNKVLASHIIVNQLVVKNALSREELNELESMAEVGNLQMNQSLLKKTVHACQLTTSRKVIQEKHMNSLKSFEETQELLDGICEVPLLPEEVTGIDAICRFSNLLVTNDVMLTSEKDGEQNAVPTVKNAPDLGCVVRIMGLQKAPHLNGLEGKIISGVDETSGRYGVSIPYQGKTKSVALLPKNISIVHASDEKVSLEPTRKQPRLSEDESDDSGNNGPPISQNTMNKAMGVLEDPEIKEMIEKNPRLKEVVQDVIENPANFLKYLADPERSPFITKAMSKLKM